LHDAGRVQVLSFVEGLPTSLAGLGFMPKIVIVPFESAYPGFGEVHVLAGQDHVDVCKPDRKGAEGYLRLVEFIRANVADLIGDNSCSGSGMPPASNGDSDSEPAAVSS
jgi:hypothetical protein